MEKVAGEGHCGPLPPSSGFLTDRNFSTSATSVLRHLTNRFNFGFLKYRSRLKCSQRSPHSVEL